MGWMYAVKLLDATMGKFAAAAAGIEARVGRPVAKQLPPQYGRSAARRVSACSMSWDGKGFGNTYIQ